MTVNVCDAVGVGGAVIIVQPVTTVDVAGVVVGGGITAVAIGVTLAIGGMLNVIIADVGVVVVGIAVTINDGTAIVDIIVGMGGDFMVVVADNVADDVVVIAGVGEVILVEGVAVVVTVTVDGIASGAVVVALHPGSTRIPVTTTMDNNLFISAS